MVVAIPICSSFEDGKCQDRLEYYVEVNRDEVKMVLENRPCPFYDNGRCKIKKGLIGNYMIGYPQKHTYEKTSKGLIEIEKPWSHEIISLRHS